MAIVATSRFLDSLVMAVFLMSLSALMLFLFGEFYSMIVDPQKNFGKAGMVLQRIFPFKRSFDYNLTHILLFSILVCLLSLREAPPAGYEEEVAKDKDSKDKEKEKAGGAAAAAAKDKDKEKEKKRGSSRSRAADNGTAADPTHED
ncbi:unnamed protein product [Vitrella brassicaformis CCMP3155]|uniref:Uncharacterized protein n=1 Tax=Vitrella brassicaformis (strain CCMP3155) TaxID=1169540 RepID=A0A0G4EDF2_VITBC|nr:unnamed protein product [Vitrella brassicaformis CCMP3155]|mmetsp:Transcript_5220/g.12297  ORF Transcript_5220/g.12297 Transcript_5220/m.12297 type:complete len:146 (-) Transcript_5220:382-819(-)|eukprot:CEL94028.1 unnamed protein product [Vitrella brassicaformis CCMP3155]